MKSRSTTQTLLAAGLLAALTLTTPALSQPARGQRDRAPQRIGAPDGEISRERIRAMAERRLEDLQQRQADLREILDMLDADASDDALREKIRTVMLDAREGAQPGRARDGRAAGGRPNPEMLEHIDPALRDRFARMRQQNPERADALLEKAGPRLERLEQLREDDPERFEARAKSMRAIHEAMRAAHAVIDAGAQGLPQSEIDAIKADYMAKVAIAVDAGVAARELELHNAELRIEKLRSNVTQARANRDRAIEKHAEEMLARAARRQVGDQDDTRPRRRRSPE